MTRDPLSSSTLVPAVNVSPLTSKLATVSGLSISESLANTLPEATPSSSIVLLSLTTMLGSSIALTTMVKSAVEPVFVV